MSVDKNGPDSASENVDPEDDPVDPKLSARAADDESADAETERVEAAELRCGISLGEQ